MSPETIKLLDELDEGVSLIEVDWRPYMDDVRTAVGIFGGFELAESRGWNLIVGTKRIRTENIVDVRRLPQMQVF